MSTQAVAPGAQYEGMFGGVNQQRSGNADRRRNALVKESEATLERQGYEVATIVNLHRFPLEVAVADLPNRVAVRAASDGEPIVRHLLTKHQRSMRDLGDANFVPENVLPVQLASEVAREYGETGGVFWYRGDGPIPEDALAAAKAKQHGWYLRQYQEATDSWGRYHQHKMITDRQRDAARFLFTSGDIAQLPEWVTLTRAMSDRADCPMCGESIKRAAKVCKECRSQLTEGWADGPAAVQAAPAKATDAGQQAPAAPARPLPGQPIRQAPGK